MPLRIRLHEKEKATEINMPMKIRITNREALSDPQKTCTAGNMINIEYETNSAVYVTAIIALMAVSA